ncbi:MAG: hypothetical protein H5T71_10995 [Chloroflexi bacterium]|nr:hypothetical protein [Chloroflexota bacterium]
MTGDNPAVIIAHGAGTGAAVTVWRTMRPAPPGGGPGILCRQRAQAVSRCQAAVADAALPREVVA